MNVNGPLDPLFATDAIAAIARARVSAAARPSRPAEPPAEPVAEARLWDLLTPEEREYFAPDAPCGSVTYGPPRRATEPPSPTGLRLDHKA